MPSADPVPVVRGELIVAAALSRARVRADAPTRAEPDAARAAR